VAFFRASRILKSGVQFLEFFVVLEQARKAPLEHGVTLIFVKLLDHDWFRNAEAGFVVSLADDSGSFSLSETRA
jgi:hypothetical protein